MSRGAGLYRGIRANNEQTRSGTILARVATGFGLSVRTAARHGADVRFDWQDPATYGPALRGIDRVYLVTPVLRDARFTDRVGVSLISPRPAARATWPSSALTGWTRPRRRSP